MAIIKVYGFLDTETGDLIIEAPKPPAKRGRKPNPKAKNAALILADAWASSNFTATASQKPARIRTALYLGNLADSGSLRTAIRNAKASADTLFPAPHKPGDIIYGRIGAVWFSDRETRYTRPEETEVLGFAWVWAPGLTEAVYTIARAVLPEGKNCS
jgi:hypothetical protein